MSAGATVERTRARVRVEGVVQGAPERVAPDARRGFRIEGSEGSRPPNALVAADVATCDACLAERLDPADRRHRYPFLNCTDRGPGLTIVRGVPYDRPLTTMAGFAMCGACRAEYGQAAVAAARGG